jgi:ATP dependent DNA ligase domain
VLYRPSTFIQPCLPSTAERPPTGADWVHEVKHDGYRLMARRDPVGVRLLTRAGHDWSPRYPAILEAVSHLRARSCLIDGEAVACDGRGLAVFELLRRRPEGDHVLMFAFDLLELDGADLRREPIETRKATLRSLLRKCRPGVRLLRAPGAPGRRGVPARVHPRLRGDRVEAVGFALSQREDARLVEVQEPGRAGREAGGGRRLGTRRVAVSPCISGSSQAADIRNGFHH